MGLKTLTQFRDKLQKMLGNRGFTNPELDDWVNLGLDHLVAEVLFDRLTNVYSGVVAQDSNTLVLSGITLEQEDGVREVRNVSDEILVTHIGLARWYQLDPDETGKPYHWTRIDGEVRVWPTAEVETEIQVVMQDSHPELTVASATTDLSKKWDRVVELLAAAHALMDLEEPDRATIFFNSASRSISTRMRRAEVEGQSTSEPVQPITSARMLRGTTWIGR